MLTVYLDSPDEIAEALVKIAGRLREGAAKIEDAHADEIVDLEDEAYNLREQVEASVEDAREITRLEAKVAELEKTVNDLDDQVDEAAEVILGLKDSLGALGVIGGGYCFCFGGVRDPDKAEHLPECRDARAVLAKEAE